MTPAERTFRTTRNFGEDSNKGHTRDDSSTSTRLLDKNWSPMIVRKYQKDGWPLFVSVICDANLNDLDAKVHEFTAEAKKLFLEERSTIQGVRNYCGYLNDNLKDHYNSIKDECVEGIAVLWYVDKMFCSSLYGDFMVHAPCKQELYFIINTLPHI
ncbi:MAG: hypothetical protein ACFFG0_00980 [Candidatus Thorarchaeota archaeon]